MLDFKKLRSLFSPMFTLAWIRATFQWIRTKFSDMSMLPHVLWMIVFGIAVTSLVGYFIWWLADTPSVKSLVKGMAMLDLIRISLLVTGGVGGIVALVVAYRRQGLGERNEKLDQAASIRAERADEREDTKLFNERFASASEQLASDKAMVRLSGVYAMATLADDWSRGRQMCINALCSYIRLPPDDDIGINSESPLNPEELWSRLENSHEWQVRETVMRVIAGRLREDPSSGNTWHGYNFDFTGAMFDRIDLSGVFFTGGEFILDGVAVIGDKVDFSKSTFLGGEVKFLPVIKNSCRIDCNSTTFKSGSLTLQAEIVDCSFSMANMDYTGGLILLRLVSRGYSHVNLQKWKISDHSLFSIGLKEGQGSLSLQGSEFDSGFANVWVWDEFDGYINLENISFKEGLLDIGHSTSRKSIDLRGVEAGWLNRKGLNGFPQGLRVFGTDLEINANNVMISWKSQRYSPRRPDK